MTTSEISKGSLVAKINGLLDHRSFLPTCFAVFVGVRCLLVLTVPVEPWSDGQWYFMRAHELAAGLGYQEGGYPTAYWPIGYPALLAGLFSLTGPSLLAAKMLNLFFAAATFWLVYAWTGLVLGVRRAARVAVLLLTIYPNHIAYTPLVLTELAYTCILLAACCALVSRRTGWATTFLAGILFGFCCLLKTQTVLYVPFLALLASWRTWSLSGLFAPAARALTVFLISIMVVAPWSMRNLRTFGTPVFVSTNGGVSLLAGNNPSVLGDYSHDYSDADPLFEEVRFSPADQVAADKRARDIAKTWILENPGSFVSLFPKKAFRLWAPDGEGEWGYQAGSSIYQAHSALFRSIRWINQGFYLGILTLAAIAAARLLRLRAPPPCWVGVTLALLITATSLVFSGQSRYHFPAMPFLMAYAGWMITVFLEHRKTLSTAIAGVLDANVGTATSKD